MDQPHAWAHSQRHARSAGIAQQQAGHQGPLTCAFVWLLDPPRCRPHGLVAGRRKQHLLRHRLQVERGRDAPPLPELVHRPLAACSVLGAEGQRAGQRAAAVCSGPRRGRRHWLARCTPLYASFTAHPSSAPLRHPPTLAHPCSCRSRQRTLALPATTGRTARPARRGSTRTGRRRGAERRCAGWGRPPASR